MKQQEEVTRKLCGSLKNNRRGNHPIAKNTLKKVSIYQKKSNITKGGKLFGFVNQSEK
jgi:hypothetical protein